MTYWNYFIFSYIGLCFLHTHTHKISEKLDFLRSDVKFVNVFKFPNGRKSLCFLKKIDFESVQTSNNETGCYFFLFLFFRLWLRAKSQFYYSYLFFKTQVIESARCFVCKVNYLEKEENKDLPGFLFLINNKKGRPRVIYSYIFLNFYRLQRLLSEHAHIH